MTFKDLGRNLSTVLFKRGDIRVGGRPGNYVPNNNVLHIPAAH